MNNNEFYGNLDRIRKLYLKENYDEAVRIADKMDFKRLKDWKYIAMLINLYETVGRIEDVQYFCTLAYNKNLGGKKLVFKLCKVMIRLEDVDEAEELYDEYCAMAGNRDVKRFELLYELKLMQGAKKAELISILESLMKRDLDEKYSYVLAELYAKSNQTQKCINMCSRIIERFTDGETVNKAVALKNAILDPSAITANASRQAREKYNTGIVNIHTSAIDTNTVASYANDSMNQNNMAYADNSEMSMYDTTAIPGQGMYGDGMYYDQNMYMQTDTSVYVDENGNQIEYMPENEQAYATTVIPTQAINEAVHANSVSEEVSLAATQVIPTEEILQKETENVSADNKSEIPDEKVEPAQKTETADSTASENTTENVVTSERTTEGVVASERTTEDVVASESTTKDVIPSESDTEDAISTEDKKEVSDTKADESSKPEVDEGVTEAKTVVISTEEINQKLAQTQSISAVVSQVAEAMAQAEATMTTQTVDSTVDTDGKGPSKEPAQAINQAADIDTTMAMVEAALANETKEAQFDARMDMPEYSESAPEKPVLRAFAPEIDVVYEIPMEVKRYFSRYSYVNGLEAQIGEYIESTKHEIKAGTSGIGNIIISGNRSSDKTTLGINLIKALNNLYPDSPRKIARTSGDNINQRGIERSIGKLLGQALIVEEAGVLDRQRVLELVEAMEGNTQELLIILEDSDSEINELLKNNPELLEKFNHRLVFKQYTVNELVEMCKRFADSKDYTIDEKALLQLYLRIDKIHSSGDGVNLVDVRDVVDTAMESAECRAEKKLFGGIKKKKIGDRELTILIESDFKE